MSPNTTKELVQFIDYEIRTESLIEDSKEIALMTFPEWKRENLVFYQLTEGITNKLVECRNVAEKKKILIRLYGKKSEYIIDREKEIFNTVHLAKQNLAEKIYSRFPNGIVYGFSEGHTLPSSELGKKPLSELVPVQLARWHRAEIPSPKIASLFLTLRKWFHQLPESYEDKIDELEVISQKINSPVTFCHNDLLSGNVLLDNSQEPNKVTFIDYEYGSYNYRGYDIANHFNEYAGFECDYSRYPTEEYQREWLAHYLAAYNGDKSTGNIKEEEIDSMIYEVSMFALASNIYWGLWALIQSTLSDLEFDYLSYAKLRFDRYYSVKQEACRSESRGL
ncbi:putative ethanolamine kinase A [Smittium mucronatum]|uniref:ethanolamine kinase n=1 Tax=Smittium mucronatum TaxID=133383 RepID=A0A1R0H6E8_9FUNG|nr:putative ethanolamine kinase A [Smittium mucronatum]